MGYNKRPSSFTGYRTKGESETAGNKFGGFQAVDKQWYSSQAFNGYAGQNLKGGFIDAATPDMQSGWAAEDEQASQAKAQEEIASVNRAKDEQMNSLMTIQKQALDQQAQNDRAQQEETQAAQAREAQVQADRRKKLNDDALAGANQKADLMSENLPNIVAGGAANASAAATTDNKKKRNGGLSTSLGINV